MNHTAVFVSQALRGNGHDNWEVKSPCSKIPTCLFPASRCKKNEPVPPHNFMVVRADLRHARVE